MRHSWTELWRHLQERKIDEEELLRPSAQSHIHNFKAAYALSGKGSVEAVFSHCNMLRAVLCGDGSVTDSHLRRAVLRAKPKPKKKFNTIWSLQQLSDHIRGRWPVNDMLTEKELLVKAMALTMIFTGCRLTELATMKLRKENIHPETLLVEMCVKTKKEEWWPVEVKTTSDEHVCP
jgi:integrase